MLSETVDAYLTCLMNFISCVSAATRAQAVSAAASESPVLQTTSEEPLLPWALGSGGLRDGEALSQEVSCCRSVAAVLRRDGHSVMTVSSGLPSLLGCFSPLSPVTHPSRTQARSDLPVSG